MVVRTPLVAARQSSSRSWVSDAHYAPEKCVLSETLQFELGTKIGLAQMPTLALCPCSFCALRKSLVAQGQRIQRIRLSALANIPRKPA